MKKGFKAVTAAALAISALTPVAAFAAENTVENGVYTTTNFYSLDAFKKLSGTAKAAALTSEGAVIVVAGKVYTGANVLSLNDTQLDASAVTVDAYNAANDNKLVSGQPIGGENQTVEIKVESVSAITANYVEVTFAALTKAVEGATVEVKDNKGNVVEVVAQDLAKGAKSAQFDFKAEYKADQEGIWTVNGAEYSFVVIKQFEDIMDAVGANNEVKLLEALNAAGIKDINEDIIGDYLTAIGNAVPSPENLTDVQKLVDEANKEAGEATDEAAVVKAVADATTQPQLLKVLQENFERVNGEWIVDYAAKQVATTGTPTLLGLDETNYVGKTNATTVAAIQDAIDAVNTDTIDGADTTAATSTEQAKVTALIQNWVKNDDPKTPSVTPKADAIEASKIKTAAFKVAEATTQSAVYNALVAYANITPDATLKASELNDQLKADYLTALTAKTKAALVGEIQTGTENIKGDIVTAADAAALNAALVTIDGLTSTDKADVVKKALQKLADVTAHKTGADKFSMSKVLDEKLVDYVTLPTHGFDAATINSISLVNKAITDVNAAVESNASLKVIANSSSTTAQVRDALIELALANSNTTTDAFVNASSQVKLEVAQFVLDNQANLASPLTLASVVTDGNAAYDTHAIGKAVADHAAKVAEFNAIGNLSNVTTADIKAGLDTYAYAPYEALSKLEQLAVAEEIGKLTKPVTTNGVTTDTPLNFAGDDAVKTLKAANDIIDAAIAKVK